ncbi:MAG: TIGR01212 family radical SAM protein [Bacteriovorax sp.]|nr:TIGR01212 family radical SAM protein [Bacteriovorax sp.]
MNSNIKSHHVINEFNRYILNRFGERIQKVSVDAGFTCPNRDGKISYGGCTYCNNDKFNQGRDKLGASVTQQITTQVKRIKTRYKNAKKFIVYFQAYSNTYAPLQHLKKLYLEALACPDIIGLTIGTRPDCITEEALDFLAELAKQYYITIEYGLESMSDETLMRINRGHDYQCFKNAVNLTKNRGINICTHLMIGFPWETQEDYIQTAIELSKLEIDYLKIHQLQIVKHTIMGNAYLKNSFHLLSKFEYLEILSQFFIHLSPQIVIQRVAGDCSKDLLIAAGWIESSNEIKIELKKLMQQKRQTQGMLYI